MNKLTKRKYYVAIVPENSIRVLLCIFQNEQWLVNDDLMVKKINIGVKNNTNLPIIIDGYINIVHKKKKKDETNFYPIDLLYNGKKINKESNEYKDRLEMLKGILTHVQTSNLVNSINIKKINYIANEEIIQTIKSEFDSKSKTILFIPEKGKSIFYEWTKGDLNKSIVLKIISIEKGKKGLKYILGIPDDNGGGGTPVVLNKLTQFNIVDSKNIRKDGKLGDSVMVYINLNSKGEIHPEKLYYDIFFAPESEYLGSSKTNRKLHHILYPIYEEMFNGDGKKWILGDDKSRVYKEKNGQIELIEEFSFE